MISVFSAIDSLIEYTKRHNLIDKRDEIYTRNRLLETLMINEYVKGEEISYDFEVIKRSLIEHAKKEGIIKSKGTSFEDNFIARVMDIFIKFPSQIEGDFFKKYSVSSEDATDFFYNFSKATDYIKTKRLSNNIKWSHFSDYGEIIITINLAKPEKTPEEILLAKQNKAKKYPKCVLCKENEGLSGINRAPRQNHRIIRLNLDNRLHYFQYSPYSYFNEHCIVLTDDHTDMNLDVNSVTALVDFVDMFEHYFIASNTDLPLVGGSILSHEHYQGGKFVFPLDKAKVISKYNFKDIVVEKLKWPMTSIRIKSFHRESLIKFTEVLMDKWKNYDNYELGIISKTGEIRHNSLNFVVRKNSDEYSIIIVFRNNRCDSDNPKGIFTTKDEYRAIKNENIGIIEVLGLAILPGRIKDEIEDMKVYLNGRDLEESSFKHRDFLDKIKPLYDSTTDLDSFLKDKIGGVFVKILSNCSVFSTDEKAIEAVNDFLSSVGSEYEKVSVKK